MAERHILFFDIDGTIFYHKRIPFRVASAIKKAQKAGHLVVINTGRSKPSIPKKVLKKINWDGFVCGGAYAEIGGEIVQNDRFLPEDFTAIVDIIERSKIPTLFDGIEKTRSLYFPYVRPAFSSANEIINEKWVEKVFKLQMCTHLKDDIAKEIGQYATPYDMGSYFDIFIKGRSKATGMKAICEKTGIPVSRTIAFGDNNNDIDMLRFAGKSVAMKRAPQKVIKIATYHAKRHKYGVPEGIKLYLGL